MVFNNNVYFYKMFNLAIFISGKGTNAKNIIEYFQFINDIQIKIIVSNNPCPLLLEPYNSKISFKQFSKQEILRGDKLLNTLKSFKISHIILAGFLIKIPASIINIFPKKIINIHPSLLPDFGGKGMYGFNVHKAVYFAQKNETGITIHLVNSEYDDGKIIFQAKCTIFNNDKPKDIQKKVQKLEYKFYPIIIEKYIFSKNDN